MSKPYPPSVVAFLEEQDMIRAHRDRLGEDLKNATIGIEALTQELRQSEHRGEFLQAQVNRITDQRDIYSRTSTRVVAKVETMLKTITMMVEDLADEIRRAQFEEPSRPKSEDEKYVEGEQWTEEDQSRLRERGLNPRRPSLQDIAEKKAAQEALYHVGRNTLPPDPDEERNDDEENSDVDAERIGKQFGAGFPEDPWDGRTGNFSQADDRTRYTKPSLFPDSKLIREDMRRSHPGYDGRPTGVLAPGIEHLKEQRIPQNQRPATASRLPPGPFG